jgi:hypothetical protein
VTINNGATTTTNGTYTVIPQAGSLTVTINPAEAVNAGAKWQVDGGSWTNSGVTVSGLSTGLHTVAYSTVSGYTTPGSQTVTISDGATTTTNGTYTVIPQAGSLTVTINPAEAVSAGAKWQVDGDSWTNSGVTISGLSTGLHTVAYSTVSGYTTPVSQSVTISNGATTTTNGTYTVIPQSGSLTVTILPAGVVSAGAQWQVDGGSWTNSGVTLSGLSTGLHTVAYSTVTGYTTPASQSVTINNGATTTTNGTYVLVVLTSSLGVSVTELVPVVHQGQNASNDSFAVWNAGDGTLTYTISSNAAWLTVGPNNGSSSGATNTHTVTFNTASLSNGIYDATITISAPGAGNSPKTIGVTLYVADEFDESTKDVSLKMKVNFAPGKLDTASLKGALDLPVGTVVSNVEAQLSIGSVTVPFTLNGKGTGVHGDKLTGVSSLKLSRKGKPVGSNQLWQVTGKFKGDFDALWAVDGLANTNVVDQPLKMPVLLLLESNPTNSFYIEKSLFYKAKQDKSGSAK